MIYKLANQDSNLVWWCLAGICLALRSRRKPLKHRKLKEIHVSITLYACCVQRGNTAPNLPPILGGGRSVRAILGRWLLDFERERSFA
jgi:hypothetical protein